MATVYDEGRRVAYSHEGVTVTRYLRVEPYSDVPYVADLMLGGVRLVGGYLVRIPPSRDPWLPFCYCTEVQEEGLGAWTFSSAPSGLYNLIRRANYAHGAKLVATYRSLSTSLDPNTADLEDPPGQPPNPPTGQGTEPSAQQEIDLAINQIDFSGQIIQQDGHKLVFSNIQPDQGDGTYKVAAGAGAISKTIPMVDITLTRKFVIRPPWAAIHDLVGTINKSAITYRGRITWPAQTLRFDGLKSSQQVTTFGLKTYELVYAFKGFFLKDNLATGGVGNVGWLRKFDWDSQQWDFVTAPNNHRAVLYEFDEDVAAQTINGNPVRGYSLLFHPRAV